MVVEVDENGDKHWYLNDKYHRDDGPAVEYAKGSKYWYLNGEQVTEAEFNKKTSKGCGGKLVEIVVSIPTNLPIELIQVQSDGKKYKLVSV